jgi:ABC-type sugar transport system ATPase subunit
MVKVVCDAIEPDRGQVFIEGGEIPANDPQQALASGVVI